MEDALIARDYAKSQLAAQFSVVQSCIALPLREGSECLMK